MSPGQPVREVAEHLKPFQPLRKPEQDVELKRGPFDPGGQPAFETEHRFRLGLCGWNVSDASALTHADDERRAEWGWGRVERVLQTADRIGVDFLLSRSGWAGNDYGEQGFDSISSAYAAGVSTERIVVNLEATPTSHLHPVHLARFASNVDHLADGRSSVTIAPLSSEVERNLFGIDALEDERRYEVADEFVTLMKHVWSAALPFNFAGEFFTTAHCLVVGPRTTRRPRPLLFYSGFGEEDLDLAAKHCDWFLLRGPNLPDVDLRKAATDTRETAALRYGRRLDVLAHAFVVAEESEDLAQERYGRLLETVAGAPEAALGLGALQLVGTYDQVAERLVVAAREDGLDGMALAFDDPLRGLHALEDELIPRLAAAGLRTAPRRA